MKLYGAQGVSPQVLLAYALSHGYQLSPPPALARTPLGKPYFPQYPHLHINWSHSGSLVLCALSDSPVGVDVEWVRPGCHASPVCSDPRGIRRLPASGGRLVRFLRSMDQKGSLVQIHRGRASAATGRLPSEDRSVFSDLCRQRLAGLRVRGGIPSRQNCLDGGQATMKLTQAFYHRDTRLVAQALLGKYLVRFQDGLPLVVRIQETEAYIGRMDKACHAYNYRRTPRTETLFAPPAPPISISFMVCITA